MCGELKSRNKFDDAAQQSWEKLLPDPVYCNKCLGVAAKQDDADWEYCNGRCQQRLPDWHFVEHMLQDWKNRESPLEIQCARCCVAREALALVHKCIKCQRDKHIFEFSPYAAKDWLGKQVDKSRYLCVDCVLPECFKCKKRAPFPKHYVKIKGDDGEYHDCCPQCRASDLQLCSMCEVQKPLGQFRKLKRGTHAKICITCESPPCYNCGKAYPAGAEPFKKNNPTTQYYCSESCKYPPCASAGCRKQRPRSEAKRDFFRMPVWYCWAHSDTQSGQ